MDHPRVRLVTDPTETLWDICCEYGRIESITRNEDSSLDEHPPTLIAPSLCHPHVHLDKCFLLSHPKYADLCIERGDFAEALSLTSRAKARFQEDDLMERGRWLIEESLDFGVTHMRAFFEVDPIVELNCFVAGVTLKENYQGLCEIQVCAFAQDPIFSYEDGGYKMRLLMEAAASSGRADVIGSTPYVETSIDNEKANIAWTIDIAKKYGLMLDFHLDYHLNPDKEPMVYEVIDQLKKAEWPSARPVALGHCTRLTLFTDDEWRDLRQRIGSLPISFIGLPTSDLYMMDRPEQDAGGGERQRGTLQVPQLIQKYGLDAAIGINNVGNAFTPHGSCDPLALTSMGVGVYQAGSMDDARLLLECVSVRAKRAIGINNQQALELAPGDEADFVTFLPASGLRRGTRPRRTLRDVVSDAGKRRMTIRRGNIVHIAD